MEDYSMEQPEVKVFFVMADGSLCSNLEDAQEWDKD